MMLISRTVSDFSTARDQLKGSTKTMGFVATMGALHEGHLSLIRRAKEENDLCCCSIFVNPTQFNDPKDFELYPKTEEEDLKLLEAEACDMVFLPQVKEIYPKNYQQKKYDFAGLDQFMEGRFRPGHFQGVANVVKRLLEIVKPDKAYFGEKDYQQLAIIRKMCEMEDFKLEIVPHYTQREANGLAMSSRNQRLSPEGLITAANIFKTMQIAKQNADYQNLENSRENAIYFLEEEGIEVEYFMFCDEEKLLPVTKMKPHDKVRVFVAAYVEEIRLIDNLQMY